MGSRSLYLSPIPQEESQAGAEIDHLVAEIGARRPAGVSAARLGPFLRAGDECAAWQANERSKWQAPVRWRPGNYHLTSSLLFLSKSTASVTVTSIG